jgi:hypothetical protein
MKEPDRARLPADRTISIDGPFQTGDERDGHWAQATITAQGGQYRVAVVIPGPSEFHHFFGMTDEEREEARGWFALIELAHCPTSAFESDPTGALPEVTVSIAQAPPLQRWLIEDVLNYVHEELREYALERKGSTWQARQTASPKRPVARPQAQQPRVDPRPPAPGPRRTAERGRKPSRPMIITYDPVADDPQPPTNPGSKKNGMQTLFDSLGEILKNVARM